MGRHHGGPVKPLRVKASGTKVVVGYPRGGSITGPFAESVQRLIAHETVKGPSRLLHKVNSTAGLYVADNRMILTERFLDESDADWLLQVDTDIEFPPTLLETMVALAGHDRRILAASVPLGEAYPTGAFLRSAADGPGVFRCVNRVPETPIEVDGIATAVVLIHREVFEGIAERHGRCWWHHMYLAASPPETPPREFKFISQGEDLAFCARAQEAGFRIWCAHVKGLGHYKTRRLTHDEDPRFVVSDRQEIGELVAEG